MAIDNCRKCGAIFQRVNSPFCRACEEREHSTKSEMYRYIHDNPGADIELLAEKFSIKRADLERMIFSGELGTASQLIKFHCPRCKSEFTPSARVGHFCDNCQKSVVQEVETTKSTGVPAPDTPPPAPKASNNPYTYKPSKPLEDTRREKPASSSGSAGSSGSGRGQFGFKRIS